jgi:hypothetical protein
MKKVLTVISFAFLALSCEKNNPKPNEPCNCGIIQSDNAYDNSIVIKNSCSGNNKTFYLSEADWMTAYVGTDYCITNVTNW